MMSLLVNFQVNRNADIFQSLNFDLKSCKMKGDCKPTGKGLNLRSSSKQLADKGKSPSKAEQKLGTHPKGGKQTRSVERGNQDLPTPVKQRKIAQGRPPNKPTKGLYLAIKLKSNFLRKMRWSQTMTSMLP